MDEQVRELRAKVRGVQQGRPPTAVRYPIAIRRQVTALARRRQAGGTDVTAIARAVGVAPWTLALVSLRQGCAGPGQVGSGRRTDAAGARRSGAGAAQSDGLARARSAVSVAS